MLAVMPNKTNDFSSTRLFRTSRSELGLSNHHRTEGLPGRGAGQHALVGDLDVILTSRAGCSARQDLLFIYARGMTNQILQKVRGELIAKSQGLRKGKRG